MNGCHITIDKLHEGQYDVWFCCFRVPILFFMQNMFASNKEGIYNEYETHSVLHLKSFIQRPITRKEEAADLTE